MIKDSLKNLIFIPLIIPFICLLIYFLNSEYNLTKDFLFVIDDVWIHLEFARNIAVGNGFSFNPHEAIAASTAPLYTIVLALLYKVSSSYIFNVYVISVISTILIIYFSYKTTYLLTKSTIFSFVTTLFISINPWITWNALSGMEIALGSFLLTAGFYYYFVSKEKIKGYKQYFPVFFFSLATLIRPESYSILFLYYLLKIITLITKAVRKKLYRKLFRSLFFQIIITLLIIMPYGLFSIRTTGSFFPNTYTAKVGDLGIIGLLKKDIPFNAILSNSLSLIKVYFIDFQKALKEINNFGFYFFFPSFLLFIYQTIRERSFKLLFIPGVFVIFPIMVGLLVPTDRVSWPWNRHMLYLTPILIQLVMIASWFAIKRFKKILWPVITLLIVLNLYNIKADINQVKKFFVDRTVVIKNEHVALARWVSDNIDYRAKIAASDIGTLGFYTSNYIFDTEGLINPEIRNFKYRRNSYEKDKEVLAYLEKVKPDYLVKFSWVYSSFKEEDFPKLKQFGNFAIYKTPWTRY